MGGEKIRKICGDGLLVQLESNDCILEVTGDGCRITMTKNCGRVRVVGDGCHLKIAHNIGDIVYKGDGGQVQLGPKSSKENVRYIGDGGKVTFDSNESNDTVKSRTHSVRTKQDRRRNHETPVNSQAASNEEQENLLNEKKEMEQKNRRSNPELRKTEFECSRNGRKCGKEIVKTKIVTTINCEDHKIVRKWFTNPNSVIKSFERGCTEVTSKRAHVNV